MNTNTNNSKARRFAPWTALLVLSLLTAIVLVAPAVVSAQITGELSQECDFALLGNLHTITATVSEGGTPGAGMPVFFYSMSPFYYGLATFEENDGVATFTYTANSVAPVTITLYYLNSNEDYIPLDSITTNWTDNEADLCSASPSVTVGGRVVLNAKKRGALRIALCSADGLDVGNVDLETVRLVGVAPWQSKYKDSHLCPGGKDGVGDLVFKFKNREVLEALEKSVGELEDGTEVGLALTGTMNGGKTPFEGEWLAVIKKEGKMHWKDKHKKDKNHKDKENKKDKIAKK